MTTRDLLHGARSLVVKVGSAVLTAGTDALDDEYMHTLAATITSLRDEDRRIIVVTSGAIAAGLPLLALSKRPTDLATLQAAASLGQPLLMDRWTDAFDATNTRIAQVLVNRTDFDDRARYLNIRNCISRLHDAGVIPLVNENDTVATEEISLGDNDILAAKLAAAVRAEALVILTTVPGVEDANANIIHATNDPDALVAHIRTEKSTQGRGGMTTKVEAARIASLGGCSTCIAPGRPAANLRDLLTNDSLGTFVASPYARHAGRRLWIAHTATPMGVLTIDDGAVNALTTRGASLLARGIRKVNGKFEAGDVVSIQNTEGREIARGLTNFTSDELRVIAGQDSRHFESILARRTHDEAIHRDNLAISETPKYES